MPTTVSKTRKQIAKKRNGQIEALHEFSRDSKRLHKASVRDQKLEKLASARSKKEQPLLDRATYFQKAIRERGSEPLELAPIQDLIYKFVHQYDEEYSEIGAIEEEYKNGFYLPDLMDGSNVTLLDRWEGSWSFLTSVAWVRISSDGTIKKSSFPPKGSC
ncbi:Translation machinery-associated protein 16-like protein [Colletotrichum orbiculare MAFF 240422]|uniref:Translation machinery-associated protein 16-like protein n=1 Tax=Colletotrichum orbiculare (strain 104-T / ATCC 96160 / CBS 514.97 / LARS 414 / MAFF 240422) TaxID=1213857 RepID=A0A484FV08_COLOR|nr:Translation machinery-associated protein 16-like protein [Colletotrichum orbiculare MAFF 240422]